MREVSQTNAAESISADRPLSDPGEDRFGYAPLARRLAEAFSTARGDESLVVAVFGPWGSGKSSFVNFMKHYVAERKGEEKPLIIDFNAWWFSGEEDLTRRFFSELQRTLGRKYGLRKVAKKVGGLADRLSEAPIPKAEYAKPFAWLFRLFAEDDDLPSLKESVGSLLAEKKRRLLVPIDDVDRLTNEEIRQMFKLIRAVADFPHVTYVIALDKQVAIEALGDLQGVPGEEYLEKIVQVPFELPLPEPATLQQVLFERLNGILASTPAELFDKGHWANVYMDGIRHFIETPRDITRYANALRLTYEAVREEVNAVDFLAIHALGVFMPDVYDLIRKNGDKFTGTENGWVNRNQDEARAFHEAWLEGIPEEQRQFLKDFLMRLFPRLSSIWDRTSYASDWLETWRRERRVCSPEVFPIYFQFAVPRGGIGRVEMLALLQLAHDEAAFGNRLAELARQRRPEGGTRVAVALDRLLDHMGDPAIQPVAVTMISEVLRVGDELLRPEDEGGIMDLGGNDLRIARLVHWLLPHVDLAERVDVIARAFEGTTSLTTVVGLTARLVAFNEPEAANGGGMRPDEAPRLSEQQLNELKEAAVAEVRKAAANNSLLEKRDIAYILYRWAEWGGDAEPREWATGTVQEDLALARLLETFVLASRSQALGDWASRTNKRMNPQSLEPFLDINALEPRVRSLKDDARLTDSQREACDLYLRGMEMMREGRDPGNGVDPPSLTP